MININDSEFIEGKTKLIVNIFAKDLSMSAEDAMKLWYRSKTRITLFRLGLFSHLGAPICADELKMELNNDSNWMQGNILH